MRRFIFMSLLSLLIVGLVACGDSNKNDSNNTENEVNVPVSDIIKDIKVQVAKEMEGEFGDNYLEEDGSLSGFVEADLKDESSEDPFASMLIERAELDVDKIDEGILLAPMMNVKSDEIIILKAANESHVDALIEGLEREQEVQVGIWQQYLPDQYEKVKKNIIKSKGLYVIFITSDYVTKIESLFDEKVK